MIFSGFYFFSQITAYTNNILVDFSLRPITKLRKNFNHFFKKLFTNQRQAFIIKPCFKSPATAISEILPGI